MVKDAGIEKDKATNSLYRVSSKVFLVDFKEKQKSQELIIVNC